MGHLIGRAAPFGVPSFEGADEGADLAGTGVVEVATVLGLAQNLFELALEGPEGFFGGYVSFE